MLGILRTGFQKGSPFFLGESGEGDLVRYLLRQRPRKILCHSEHQAILERRTERAIDGSSRNKEKAETARAVSAL